MPVCQEDVDPPTDGDGYRELNQFILKGVWDDGVESGAEVHKLDPCIGPWFVQMLKDVVNNVVNNPMLTASGLTVKHLKQGGTSHSLRSVED